MNAFLKERATARKNILSKFLNLQVFDSLKTRVAVLAQKQNSDWPKFLDAIHSATWAGSSLEQAILDSKAFAPRNVSWAVIDLEKDLLAGVEFDLAMSNLKARLASPIVDRFVELTRLANQSGGRGYLSALRAQSIQLRLENATWTEVQVKQNWVIASAKLAVLAPWLILLLLSLRKETAATFDSEIGMLVLLTGLVASLLAFQLVKFLSALPRQLRVLAK
jgi:tight adherence protein B